MIRAPPRGFDRTQRGCYSGSSDLLMNETFDGTFSLLQMLWGNIVARPLRSLLNRLVLKFDLVAP